ncbi:MAG: TolC family protein [Candidatus Neomarinimicrobiota bacterium]
MNMQKNLLTQGFYLLATMVLLVSTADAQGEFSKNEENSGPQLEMAANVVEQLLNLNPQVRAAESAYQAAKEKVRVAGVLPDPTIRGTFFVDPIETRNGPIETQIMVGQKIPMWGKLKRQRNTAVLKANNAFLTLQNKKIKVAFLLRKYWANYIKLDNSIQILDQYRAELESFRGIALSQYSTGIGNTQHPILKLQIEQSLIASRINSMETILENTINDLRTLFNGYFTEEMISNDWDITIPSKPVDYWVNLAGTTNPTFQIAKNSVEIASIQKEITVRKNYPDIIAGLTYSIIDETELPGAPATGKDAFGVKLGLNLPIWFKRNKARVQASTLNIKAKEALLEDSWNQIEEEINSVQKEYYETEDTYLIYRDNLIQESEQMLASAFSAYETGNISFLDLLDSERMVVKVRLEYETANANNRIASAKLLKAAGLIELKE